jgi:ABC-2 type transport system ATP-binding protein
MDAPPIVEVQGLVKHYGPLQALDGLDLRLGHGRVCAMVGPNGAGKTTTLRAMAGIVRPTAGTVRVRGHDVVADPVAARRHLAWVPHDAALFDALTVREHLELTATAWDVADWRVPADALLARFELTDKADAPAHALSRGMRQKVALACAALHRPDLLMLDEPMTGLDPRAIRTFKAWVREEAERGAVVLISSHLLTVVEDLCTDLLILVGGRPRFFGTVESARVAFSQERLEELFFTATEDA